MLDVVRNFHKEYNGEWTEGGGRMCIHHGIISMSQMSSTVRVWKEISKISSRLGHLLVQMLALLRTHLSGNRFNLTVMNKKNTRLVSTLDHALNAGYWVT